MRELIRLVEEPRPCSYLPGRAASLEYRLVSELDPLEYGELLRRGYRRFGRQIFRPSCPRCSQCVSLRVPVGDFRPSRSQKRALKANRHIRAEIQPASASAEHVRLYNRYHEFMSRHRGWPRQRASLSSYRESFVAGGGRVGRQWLFFDGARLLGVALMDEAPEALSLVYFFHDPKWRSLSPGTFSILTQLEYARQKGLGHAYLGYWIEANPSMAYKASFRPHELLRGYPGEGEEPIWRAPNIER